MKMDKWTTSNISQQKILNFFVQSVNRRIGNSTYLPIENETTKTFIYFFILLPGVCHVLNHPLRVGVRGNGKQERCNLTHGIVLTQE